MSFPSLLSLLLAGRRLRRRRALPAWLPTLVLLAGLLGSEIAQATVYTFSGNPVDTCTLSGTVYTCPYPAYLDWDDSVVIGNGYTVKVTSNVTVTYNQGLTMGSNARLIVTGNLDLTGINPANLKVSGGQIEVGGTFSMGALPQSITGNVTAGAIRLGTDKVTITGNLVSTGLVSISSGSRITGNVSGAVVATSSPVTITGNVTATSKFTLASGSSVTGAVTAPVFDMLASGSRVTGNVVASTSMTMGSGNTVTGNITTGTFDMQDSGSKVTGDIVATTSAAIGSGGNVTGNVDTGDLLLRSSSAVITGDARVNWATLGWAGRVTGTIYCKNGTAKNKCDCVTNNSGYAVNTPSGPRCDGLASKGPHHLLLTHDGEGDTCVPEKITVTACANAACTAPHYSGAVSGELAPFGTDFRIPANAGSVIVEVERYAEGSVTLGVDAGTTCYRTSTNSNSCAMNFAGGAKLLVDVPDHTAGAGNIKAALQAVKANDSKTACVPAFAGVSYPVQFSCTYARPKTGSVALGLGVQSLACAASGASPTAKGVDTAFDAEGKATLALKYADAGELRLRAYVDTQKGMTASGEGTFITAPAAFVLAPDPIAAPIRASADFKLKVTAVNLAGGTTKNFDTNDLNNAGATVHSVALDVDCHKQGGSKGLLSATPSFVDGVATVTATWSEVGHIDLRASLGNFMGSGLSATGTTDGAAAGCSGNVGPFIPAYYQVSLTGPRAIYYSGEPFAVRISAMNKAGEVTANYRPGLGLSEDVVLSANDKDGAAFANGYGALAGPAVTKDGFVAGVAETTRSYTFGASPGGPAQVRLRASNGKAAGLDVTSALPAAAESAIPLIRSGRLRIGNRFGGLKSTLSIPVTAEYWTGKSWLLHSDDQSTAIPQASFAFRATVAGLETAPVFAPGPLKLVNGSAAFALRVTQGGPGPVDIAVNLGATDYDDACIGDTAGTKVKSSPAAIPWLRPWVGGCGAGQARDPSGRATFGVYTPENRRIIHVREVFN